MASRSTAERTHPTLILAVLSLGGVTYAMLSSSVVPALPTIQHALHTSETGIAWLPTAYLLSASVGTVILGRFIQGAAGGIFPLAFGIVRDEFPHEKAAGSIGLLSAILGVGAGIGIVLSGVIVEHLNYARRRARRTAIGDVHRRERRPRRADRDGLHRHLPDGHRLPGRVPGGGLPGAEGARTRSAGHHRAPHGGGGRGFGGGGCGRMIDDGDKAHAGR